jgi:imidazoleglycerol phosphate synthase glutamine amidotransferase subunit HisH
MSRQALTSYLKKLDEQLKKQNSEVYRVETANKQTHVFSIRKTTIQTAIKEVYNRAAGPKPEYNKTMQRAINAAINNFYKEVIAAINSRVTSQSKRTRQYNIEVLTQSAQIYSIRVTQTSPPKIDIFKVIYRLYAGKYQSLYDKIIPILTGETGSRSIVVSAQSGTGLRVLSKAGDVFALEHEGRGNSNIQAFIDTQIANTAVGFDTQDLAKTLNSILEDQASGITAQEIAALKNIKTLLTVTKTEDVMTVMLGSQLLNIAEASKEQKLKAELLSALQKAVQSLATITVETKGSDSLVDVKVKNLNNELRKIFIAIAGKKIKVDFKEATISKTPSKASIDVGKKNQKAKNIKPEKIKATVRRSTARRGQAASMHQVEGPSALEMLAYINTRITDTIAKNMELPGLEYQTGRFAQSVKALNLIKTRGGFPSIQYTYQRDPYQVFEMGVGRAPWATTDRDPRKLIDRSIREIAAQFLTGRIYTRRL